jgi:hypothetical protein
MVIPGSESQNIFASLYPESGDDSNITQIFERRPLLGAEKQHDSDSMTSE